MCDFKFIDPGPCPERFFHWLSISVFHFWWLIELSYWFKAVFLSNLWGILPTQGEKDHFTQDKFNP